MNDSIVCDVTLSINKKHNDALVIGERDISSSIKESRRQARHVSTGSNGTA